jgi:hypothetical protein
MHLFIPEFNMLVVHTRCHICKRVIVVRCVFLYTDATTALLARRIVHSTPPFLWARTGIATCRRRCSECHSMILSLKKAHAKQPYVTRARGVQRVQCAQDEDNSIETIVRDCVQAVRER